MWEKCPICMGTGKVQSDLLTTCPTCEGKRIISELTGLPPQKKKWNNDDINKINQQIDEVNNFSLRGETLLEKMYPGYIEPTRAISKIEEYHKDVI